MGLGCFGGISGEETSFIVDEGPAFDVGVQYSSIVVLRAVTFALLMVAVLYYMWLAFGNSRCARVAAMDMNGQLEMFRGILRAENG